MQYRNITQNRLRTGKGHVVLPGATVSEDSFTEAAFTNFVKAGLLVAVREEPSTDELPEPVVTHTHVETPSVDHFAEDEEGDL